MVLCHFYGALPPNSFAWFHKAPSGYKQCHIDGGPGPVSVPNLDLDPVFVSNMDLDPISVPNLDLNRVSGFKSRSGSSGGFKPGFESSFGI